MFPLGLHYLKKKILLQIQYFHPKKVYFLSIDLKDYIQNTVHFV